jgi:hypothetical protein
MKKHRVLIVPAALLGVALVVIGIVYWVEPASSLPSLFPGHQAGSSHHLKHGIAAVLLGLAVLAFAWFQSGSETDRAAQQTDNDGGETPVRTDSQ